MVSFFSSEGYFGIGSETDRYVIQFPAIMSTLFMEIKNKLNELGLSSNDVVVIGSGILNALNLRESEDIDVVVTEEKYKELSNNNRFKKEQNHGREILVDDLFEIRTSWTVVGKTWKFDDLLNHSTIIDGIRYNTIEFLLDAKRRWVTDGEGRQKDIDDVKLMEKHLSDLKK